MNSTEIFSLALGLESPWEIKNVEMKVTENSIKELHLHIGYTRGFQFKDKEGNHCPVHDTKAKEWRHMNFFEHQCYIHCSVPRIKTKEGKIRQIDVPWARKQSGFTLLFEAIAMSLIENEMPVNKVARLLGEHPNRVWRIFNYWIALAYQKDDVSQVTQLGFDETSRRKGHSYITVAVDLEERRVIHVVKGKNANTIKEIKGYLKDKGVPAKQITQASIDLSPAFISGITEHFPKADITFDRFHVVKLLNEAMDTVRKQERKEHEQLKGHKYTFLKNKLSSKKQSELSELITLYPTLGEAYRLKTLFNDLWTMPDKESASGFINQWFDEVAKSKIQPFIKFAKTVKAHLSGIINFVETKITNAILHFKRLTSKTLRIPGHKKHDALKFLVDRKIPVRLRFEVDYENSLIKVIINNYSQFSIFTESWKAEEIDHDFLDMVTRYLLRQDSEFIKPEMSDEARKALRKKLAAIKRSERRFF